MKKKNIWPVIIIALTFGGTFFFRLQSNFRREQFFESKLNTTIVNIKNNLLNGRSDDYVTKNGIVVRVYLSDTLNLKINDSIIKEKNSWEFIVLRMEEYGSGYKFCRKYDLK
jgi:hypothetical protein